VRLTKENYNCFAIGITFHYFVQTFATFSAY
jgi:hypothetical protein